MEFRGEKRKKKKGGLLPSVSQCRNKNLPKGGIPKKGKRDKGRGGHITEKKRTFAT